MRNSDCWNWITSRFPNEGQRTLTFVIDVKADQIVGVALLSGQTAELAAEEVSRLRATLGHHDEYLIETFTTEAHEEDALDAS